MQSRAPPASSAHRGPEVDVLGFGRSLARLLSSAVSQECRGGRHPNECVCPAPRIRMFKP